MRLQHIFWAGLIALLAAPLVATELYLAQFVNSLACIPCPPATGIWRVDLEERTARFAGSGSGDSIVGFDPARPQVFVSSTYFGCCRLTSVDLSPKGDLTYGPFSLLWTNYAFDANRMFAIRLTDVVEIDLATGAVTEIMPLGMLAEPLAVDVAHQRMYINAHSAGNAGELRVVDLGRKTISAPLMPIRQTAAVVIDRDGTAYVFEGQILHASANVFRIDAVTNELTPFASEVLISTRRLVLDPVDRVVYGTFIRDIVSFDLVTRTTRVLQVPSPNNLGWNIVAGVIHNRPPRGRAVR